MGLINIFNNIRTIESVCLRLSFYFLITRLRARLAWHCFYIFFRVKKSDTQSCGKTNQSKHNGKPNEHSLRAIRRSNRVSAFTMLYVVGTKVVGWSDHARSNDNMLAVEQTALRLRTIVELGAIQVLICSTNERASLDIRHIGKHQFTIQQNLLAIHIVEVCL